MRRHHSRFLDSCKEIGTSFWSRIQKFGARRGGCPVLFLRPFRTHAHMTSGNPSPPGPHPNTTTVEHLVQRAERERRNAHRGAVVWLSGLPGAGKSTLAMRTERAL